MRTYACARVCGAFACVHCDCRLTDRRAAPVPPAGAGVAVESSCRRGAACRPTRSLLVRWSGRGGGGGARVMCRVVRLCVFTLDCAVFDITSCAVRACSEHVASMLVSVCVCACAWMGLGRTRECAQAAACAHLRVRGRLRSCACVGAAWCCVALARVDLIRAHCVCVSALRMCVLVRKRAQLACLHGLCVRAILRPFACCSIPRSCVRRLS